MDHWETRRKSLQWLNSDLSQHRECIDDGYSMIDECINLFSQVSDKDKANLNGRFARVCGLSTTKGRNLLLACHSLILDALSQESGALLRPLIESFELLRYFRLDPTRVDQAINGQLPSAGEISKKIDGQFKFLRDHLNEDASHFGFGFYSVSHLVDYSTSNFRTVQTHSEDVFKRNLTLLSAFLLFLLFEAISCLFAANIDAEELAQRAEQWKEKAKTLFPNQINRGA